MRLISKVSIRRSCGMTLVHTLVGVTIGVLVLTCMALIWVNASYSFAAMDNYMSMDRASRSALDQMTRDIRDSKNLTSFSTNQLVFTYSGSTNLVYNWDPASRNLTSWMTGGSTNTLLTECDWLQFTMYQSTPQTNGTFLTTTTPSQGKSISVAWKCSRTILGQKRNTEDVQEAQIIIRSKPVS